MKKSLIIITTLCMALPILAQQKDNPKFFRNTLEKCLYEAEHPENLGNPNRAHRFSNDFTARLDSVIGSNDFDRIQWKNEYTYTDAGLWNTETYYLLENNQWTVSDKCAFSYDENGNNTEELHYKWNEGEWLPYYKQQTFIGSTGLIDYIITSRYDSTWIGESKRVYTYSDGLVTKLMVSNFNGEEWAENSKYEYAYNDDRQLVSQVFSNIRNGQWRENSKDSLVYENGHCTELLSYMRMMWGGSGWMLRGKTEFGYDGDRVSSQTSYSAGWFGGGDMSFDGKTEFFYDSHGQMVSKTTSIFNESDWIIRDEYANRFDTEKLASEMMGCEAYWNLNSNYFRSDLGEALPLTYRWLSAKVVSQQADTEFTMYYSDMAGIEEDATNIKVYAANGSIIVECPTTTDLAVYDLLGRCVASRIQVNHCQISLRPGLYVVKANHASFKVVVD